MGEHSMTGQISGDAIEGNTGLVCGVDLVELATFARTLRVGGDRFLQRVYTSEEIAYCKGRLDRLAGRFAAKEAIAKALGTGVEGLDWREMEVVCDGAGCPRVRLHGGGATLAATIGLGNWSISISHSRTLVVAFVVANRVSGQLETRKESVL